MCRRGRGGGRGPECPTPIAKEQLGHAGGCAALAALPKERALPDESGAEADGPGHAALAAP
eukprot:15361809-Alexandrium_andersonii.AAC.1